MRRNVAVFIHLKEALGRFKKDQRVRQLTGALLYSTLAGGVIIFGFLKNNNTNPKREEYHYLVESGWRVVRRVRCVLIRAPP
jgi:hypothetical protein